MVFVNELAGVADIPRWAKHLPASADGMTFVDAVFPAFLFIVGMSIPFAIQRRLEKGDSWWQLEQHILFRTLGLLVLGVFMVNAEGGYNQSLMLIPISVWSLLFYLAAILIWKVYYTENKAWIYSCKSLGFIILLILFFLYRGGEDGKKGMEVHWWGILGLIGWAYFTATCIYQLVKGSLVGLCIGVVGCVAYYVILHLPAVASSGIAGYLPGTGHATHASLVLSGIILSTIYFGGTKGHTLAQKTGYAILFAVVLAIAATILRRWYPISKIGATPPWALYCSAIVTCLYIILYYLVDIKGKVAWTNFLQPAASNPLLTYIIPSILGWFFSWVGINIVPAFMQSGWPGAIWSLVFSLIILGIAYLLTKMKLRLQL